MTTSNSTDFSVSRDNILSDALMLVGAIGPDDTAPATWVTHAARQLNKVVKGLSSRRIGLWARKTGYVMPVSGTSQALLGPTGGHATLSYTQTTLSSAAASGATSVVVTSATGFGASYYVGVELDSGDMTWTTQVGAASGTTITIAAGLDSAASSGNYVYVYQTKLQRPLRIVDAFVHNQTGSNDRPIQIVSKSEYDALGQKTSEGSQNQIVYDPQLDNGVLYFYPRFTNGKEILTIIFQRPFEDFDASGDTPDFPQEWYDALCYLTAVRLAPVYGMPVADRQLLKQEATEIFLLAEQNEPEEGSIRFGLDAR